MVMKLGYRHLLGNLAPIWIGVVVLSDAAVAEANGNAWSQHVIPDATCGDGQPYSIFIRRGDTSKLVLELKGGGACWSRTTCFGVVPFAKLFLQHPSETSGLDSSDPNLSRFASSTYVIAPYCTGDVHVGGHEAIYGNRLVHHVGGRNFEALLDYMDDSMGLFEDLEEFTLAGSSAGAVGAMLNLPEVDEKVRDVPQKVLLADSAGLHFGSEFWSKFPQPFRQDIADHMSRIGMTLDVQDGILARQIPAFCERYSDWRIGFVQSTLDVVMSMIFGNTSQRQHKIDVMGPDGISRLGRSSYGSCAVWIQDSGKHTFSGSQGDLLEVSRDLTVNQFIAQLFGWSLPVSILP